MDYNLLRHGTCKRQLPSVFLAIGPAPILVRFGNRIAQDDAPQCSRRSRIDPLDDA
ncbi:MAG: hypothetical protein WD184_07295 [Acidimicrobiia bacterium]